MLLYPPSRRICFSRPPTTPCSSSPPSPSTAPGYRFTGREHHRTTFQALALAMGNPAAKQAAYFDTCRRKRNAATYDQAGLVSETEVEDLITEASTFQQDLEHWIKKNQPQFAAS